MNKYILPVFIFLIVGISGVFLYVIFSDSGKTDSTQTITPPIQNSSSLRFKEMEAVVEAQPEDVKVASEGAGIDPKNNPSINLEVTYHNNTDLNLTGFQIQILNGQKLKYKTGSTLTAKFNKDDTVKNKRATYDVAPAKPGGSNTASIQIQGFEPGILDFRALVTTKEGPKATSVPITVTVY